ncbi:MAG TPA: hypothetical protein VFJ52_13340 [Terriglobia bacterium]|nr:hypothetical protein [Terriglobia bacterium]
MGKSNTTLALVSSSEFKWTAEIQYMESLANRDDAIKYASRHGCNLIVKYEKRNGPQFDVMLDPESRWTSEAGTGQSGTVTAVEKAKSGGRRKRGFLGMFGFTRRIDGAPAGVSRH